MSLGFELIGLSLWIFVQTLSFVQAMNDKQQDKKKKKGGNEIKRPCPPYSLWCKAQWNEVNKEIGFWIYF
jgi:hypothetical protein